MDEDQAPAGGCGGTWAFSQSGVDLNRNNTFHWGGQGSSSDPCDQTFKGKAAGSEPEDSSLADAASARCSRTSAAPGASDPAPADTTGAMVTIHTVAGLVMLPWSYDHTVHAPNDAALRSMAFRQNYYNHYTAGQSGEVLYDAAGTSDDLAYSDLGIASFTWELDGSGGGCQGEFLPLYTLHGRLRGQQPARPVLRRRGGADAVHAVARPDHDERDGEGLRRLGDGDRHRRATPRTAPAESASLPHRTSPMPASTSARRRGTAARPSR